MRRFRLVLLTSLLVGCRPTIDVQGMYVGDHDEGTLFPCDNPRTLLRVPDTVLAGRYRLIEGAAREPIYVHLRGVQRRAGSIYGGPRYFLVREILEVRTRRAGECPDVALPIAPLFSVAPAAQPPGDDGARGGAAHPRASVR